jgi:hypothetical protein
MRWPRTRPTAPPHTALPSAITATTRARARENTSDEIDTDVRLWIDTTEVQLRACSTHTKPRHPDRSRATRPGQARPDQTRPDQIRPDQTRPDQGDVRARQNRENTHRICQRLRCRGGKVPPSPSIDANRSSAKIKSGGMFSASFLPPCPTPRPRPPNPRRTPVNAWLCVEPFGRMRFLPQSNVCHIKVCKHATVAGLVMHEYAGRGCGHRQKVGCLQSRQGRELVGRER